MVTSSVRPPPPTWITEEDVSFRVLVKYLHGINHSGCLNGEHFLAERDDDDDRIIYIQYGGKDIAETRMGTVLWYEDEYKELEPFILKDLMSAMKLEQKKRSAEAKRLVTEILCNIS